MEGTFPARALAVSGVAMTLLAAGATVPVSGSTTATPAPVHATGAQPRVLAHAASARAHHSRTTARWSGSIRVSVMSAVDDAYTRAFDSGLDLATGWTGSDSRCDPGTTSAASRAATLRAVNFVRAMSGLAPVTLLPHPERPLPAHRADDVGQPLAEPHAAAQLALLVAGRRRQRRTLQPGAELPVDHLGRPGRALHARPRRRQRRGRSPALAAEPVRHRDGHRVHRHRQRDDRHRPHRGATAQPGLGLVADRRLLPDHPRAGRPLVALGRQQADGLPSRDRARLPQRRSRSRDQAGRAQRLCPADPGLAAAGRHRAARAPSRSSSAART